MAFSGLLELELSASESAPFAECSAWPSLHLCLSPVDSPFLWLIFLTALALKAAGSDVILSATLVELDAAILVGCLIGATLRDSHTTIFDVYVALHGPHLEPNCRNHSSSSSSRVLLIPQCIICSSKKLEAAFKQQLLC